MVFCTPDSTLKVKEINALIEQMKRSRGDLKERRLLNIAIVET
jgi:hypothetical protein